MGAQALRHDSLGAQLAGVMKHQGGLGVRHKLIQAHSGKALSKGPATLSAALRPLLWS